MIVLAGTGVVYPSGTAALRGVDLHVRERSFTVLVGPSGGGKTTLLKCINGSVKPTGGTVVVDGTDVAGAGESGLRALRRRIAVIPQQFNLIRRSSVRANALAGRLAHVGLVPGLLGLFPHADKQIAGDNLARLGLADKALRRVDTLSGGEQQRVAICRALTQEPRIILADEPVSNLDHKLAATTMEILRTINEQDGITLVVALHDVRLARAYADRIVLLNAGCVLFDGSPSDITLADLSELEAGHGTA